MKTALIDYISPIGHVSLINFYLKNFENYFSLIFLNKNVKILKVSNSQLFIQKIM